MIMNKKFISIFFLFCFCSFFSLISCQQKQAASVVPVRIGYGEEVDCKNGNASVMCSYLFDIHASCIEFSFESDTLQIPDCYCSCAESVKIVELSTAGVHFTLSPEQEEKIDIFRHHLLDKFGRDSLTKAIDRDIAIITSCLKNDAAILYMDALHKLQENWKNLPNHSSQ